MIPAPNGFFLHDMLWLDLPKGDALIVKGFRVELQDVSGASVSVLNALHSALSNLLYGLPDNVRMQSQWQVTSDYREVLQRYNEATGDASNEWTVFNRSELHHRLTSQMERGVLRREEHILWFTKHLDTPLSKITSSAKAVERHIGTLLEREAMSFENLGRSLQQSLGSFAAVTALDDLDNFITYRNFLNPSLISQERKTAELEFDPEASIQDLVFRSDAVRVESENASFHFANRYQTLFVISRWPSKIRPLDVMALTNLPFNDYVITTNIIPKNTREEISKEERLIERLEGEIISEKKRSLQTSKEKKERKVDELARGYTRLFSTLQIIRVWDETAEGLSSKCEAIKAAISDMGAQYYHVTSATGARNLFMQTWPGNTHTKYRGYDIESSNQSLACLLPFSSTFTGLLDGAEALSTSTGFTKTWPTIGSCPIREKSMRCNVSASRSRISVSITNPKDRLSLIPIWHSKNCKSKTRKTLRVFWNRSHTIKSLLGAKPKMVGKCAAISFSPDSSTGTTPISRITAFTWHFVTRRFRTMFPRTSNISLTCLGRGPKASGSVASSSMGFPISSSTTRCSISNCRKSRKRRAISKKRRDFSSTTSFATSS